MLLEKADEMECAVASCNFLLGCRNKGFCARAQERLGVLLEKADEMECAVAGCNFLLGF